MLRGTIHPVRVASVSPSARETLQADLEFPVVSLDDMYGGKLVAAMDRQHPRDLFDVMNLFAHEGITAGIRRAFVIYLASHNRPVHEVLFPQLRDIRNDYENNFEGMTEEPVALNALLAARKRMVRELQAGLSAEERRFLLSLVAQSPNGHYWAWSTLSNYPDCDGSCKTWHDFERPMLGSLRNYRTCSRGGWPHETVLLVPSAGGATNRSIS